MSLSFFTISHSQHDIFTSSISLCNLNTRSSISNSVCLNSVQQNTHIYRLITWIHIHLYIHKCRISMDNPIKILLRILHSRLGQSPTNSPPLLHQLRLVSGGLLPDLVVQLRGIQEHHRQPRPSLHNMGHSSQAASEITRSQRLQENDPQQQALCAEVQEERSSSVQD